MHKYIKKIFFIFVFFLIVSCGGAGSGYEPDVPTQTDPLIETVSPNPAKAGDEVSIKGIGFSSVYPLNVVMVGDILIQADDYTFLVPPEGEFSVEEIKFTLPDDIKTGDYDLIVVVHENVSEVVDFTVE